MRVFSFFLFIVFLVISSYAEEHQKYALLVGCTKYPYLDAHFSLKGPENDIRLLKRVVGSHPLYIKSTHIKELSGWNEDVTTRPSYKNITLALEDLVEKSRKNTQIMIYLAGHGSQQPANIDKNDVEMDGMDEIFLPADVKGWNDSVGKVENSISDDELRNYITKMRNKGAYVWLVVDSCHSGTMSRGNSQVVYRDIPMSSLVPNHILEKHRKKIKQKKLLNSGTLALDLHGDASGITAMYACLSSEKALELPLPDKSNKVHGLFTYSMCEALQNSEEKLTYRELLSLIALKYKEKGYFFPNPGLEGGGLDKEVLGIGEWPERPRLLLQKNGSKLSINAGELYGIGLGSILEVYPRIGLKEAEKPFGFLKVVAIDKFSSKVEPISLDGIEEPEGSKLESGCRVKLAYINSSVNKMKIYLQTYNPEGRLIPFEKKFWTESLKKVFLNEEYAKRSLIMLTDKVEQADWFARFSNNEVLLVHKSGGPIKTIPIQTSGSENSTEVVRVKDDGELGLILHTAFDSMARVRNMLRLQSSTNQSSLRLKLDIVKYTNENDEQGKIISDKTWNKKCYSGDLIAFKLQNLSRKSMKVALFFIDSQFGISLIFPAEGTLDDNRLRARKTLITPMGMVSEDTLGSEHLVALAVDAHENVDFSILEQSSLNEIRTRGKRSALDELLQSAILGKAKTRGFVRKSNKGYFSAQVISWETVKRR